MTNRATAVLFVLLVAGCVSGPVYVHGSGPPPDEIASYAVWNAAKADGREVQLFTLELDGKTRVLPGGVMTIKPGAHVVRITFSDEPPGAIPAIHNPRRVFRGWYEVSFIAQAGKFYEPTLNVGPGESGSLGEACVAEREVLIAENRILRESRQRKWCAKSTLPPTPENIAP